MKQEPYILVIPSWYPNRYDQFTGDFNQRHCMAFSGYKNLVVLKLVKRTDGQPLEEERIQRTPGLLEIIIYFPARKSVLSPAWMNGIKQYFLYKKAVKNLIRERGKPVAVHGMVIYNGGFIAALIKRWLKVPLFLTENWTVFYPADPAYSILRHPIKQQIFQYVFTQTDLFLPVCRKLHEQAAKRFRVPEPVVMPNVVDTSLFNFRQKKASRTKKLLHVSTMYNQKNMHGMIRAINLLADKGEDVELTLAGPPSEEIQQYIYTFPLLKNRVQFTGEVPYGRVAKLMQEHHILVLFSWYENLPCVILEALCSGMVVVSSDVGGVAEVINEKNGLLVPPGDETALAEALQDMLRNYSAYQPELIAAAADSQFSYSTVGTMMARLYDEFITREPTRRHPL